MPQDEDSRIQRLQRSHIHHGRGPDRPQPHNHVQTSALSSTLLMLTATNQSPLSVLALVPPMQIHVFESTSSRPMAREMAKHNLGLCMLAMEELGKSFISAIAAYKLFDTAIRKVETARGAEQKAPAPPSPSDGMQAASAFAPASWENWPEGYSASTASVITDVWLPWTYGLGNQ